MDQMVTEKRDLGEKSREKKTGNCWYKVLVDDRVAAYYGTERQKSLSFIP